MQDGGCKVYMDSYMVSNVHVSWSLGLFQKPPLGGRPHKKLGDHGTPDVRKL
jgi:hypothetical protein